MSNEQTLRKTISQLRELFIAVEAMKEPAYKDLEKALEEAHDTALKHRNNLGRRN